MPKQIRLFVTSSLLAMTLLVALILFSNTGMTQAAPAAQTLTLTTQADAMVDARFPGVNYGAGALGVAPGNQSYVWFDLSGLPTNAVIESAVLQLMPAEIVGQGPHTVGVGRVQDPWDEATVTGDTKPGVSDPAVITTVEAATLSSWNVTPLVKQWQAGTLNNYGFALLTNTAGVWFHAKETGPAPRLMITASLPAEDDPDEPVPPGNPFSDLGDAPDSTNNHGQNNTAYSGTLGHFPTVYQGTAAGQPAGPVHVNVSVEAVLGDSITREAGADDGADADGVNNILRTLAGAVADTADNDRADDGWRNRNVPILDCQRTTLVVRVRKAPGAQLDKMYLNVFHDGNQDGDWADVGICRFADDQQARSYEWIVQDYAVDLSAIPAGSSQNVTVTTVLVHSPSANAEAKRSHWMRFSLSERLATRNPATTLADGRGPHPSHTPKVYAFGETEDILYQPDPQGQPGVLTLQKAVIVSSTPVGYADTVTYTIRLKNTGGTEPVQAEIRDLLPYPLHLLPYIEQSSNQYVMVKELSSGVSPLNAQLDYRTQSAPTQQVVRWAGTLAPDAQVELSFRVHVHPLCRAGQNTVPITNTATLHKADGSKMDEKSASFEAACPGFSVDDIQVEQTVITDRDSGQANAAQAETGDAESVWGDPHVGFKTGIRSTFTNNAKQPVTVGALGNFEIQDGAAEAAAVISPVCRVLTLDPGETRTLDVWTDMRPLALAAEAIPDNPAQELAFRSRLRYAILPTGEAAKCETINSLPADLFAENLYPFKIRPWDVGDAPDRTNHLATAMTAYPGVPANFPTLFDVTTGAPEGPRHARPGPFHLGPQVEFEPDADLGAAPLNIDPTTNTPNRDRYDDGVNLASMSFQNCQKATFQAQVYITPAAQADLLNKGIKTAFINSWVDSNRDGDWADGPQCPAGNAPEHIVIDQPVDIASLTPGLNTLTVATTGPVPWPAEMAQKPAWLRVMLSEEKSVKLAGQPYGDGRGPAAGYRTGETEDYLLFPKGQGADPALDLGLAWEPLTASDGATARANKVTLRVEYRNEGSDPALDASLIITLPTALRNATLLDAIGVPDLNLDKATPPGVMALGTLQPGQRGVILYSWKVEEGESLHSAAANGIGYMKLGDIKGELRSSSPDADPSNNARSRGETTLGDVVVVRFGIPDSPYKVNNATTSRDNLEVSGIGRPNSTLTIFVDGVESSHTFRSSLLHWGKSITETVQTGTDGSWSFLLKNMSGGLYRVGTVYGSPGLNRTATFDKSSTKLQEALFRVDPNLPIDPLSFIIGDGGSMNWTPDTLNFNMGMPPTVFVPGRTYTMRVQRTPGVENLDLALQFQSPFQVGSFEDLGGGGLGWVGCLTCTRSSNVGTGIGGYALLINHDGEETILGGTYNTTALGKVTDAATGQPINGATVRLLAQTAVSDTLDSGFVYASWDGAGGQTNPQATGGDGSYLFVPPAGSYRVQVTAPGYQPFTSPAVDVADGEAVAQAIALSPAVTDAADVTVSIGPGGFDPGVLVVPPGTTVRWVNVDVVDHSVAGSSGARAAGGFDSGILSPGASYTLTAGGAGTFSLADGVNPFNQATLVIDPNAPSPGMNSVFLPALQR
ncbi:MAG: DNRLRE domain-containing protein [Caldilineaceae bacterium]|nr:DNRLRE domain-containing protein [Caldilineaceae bacterium]